MSTFKKMILVTPDELEDVCTSKVFPKCVEKSNPFVSPWLQSASDLDNEMQKILI